MKIDMEIKENVVEVGEFMSSHLKIYNEKKEN